MSKFYGRVGYGMTVEKDPVNHPGVLSDDFVEKSYYGDVLRNVSHWVKGASINDNMELRNKISIMADKFAWEYFSLIKYVEWEGVKWKVTEIEVERPRLVLTIGGVFNE